MIKYSIIMLLVLGVLVSFYKCTTTNNDSLEVITTIDTTENVETKKIITYQKDSTLDIKTVINIETRDEYKYGYHLLRSGEGGMEYENYILRLWSIDSSVFRFTGNYVYLLWSQQEEIFFNNPAKDKGFKFIIQLYSSKLLGYSESKSVMNQLIEDLNYLPKVAGETYVKSDSTSLGKYRFKVSREKLPPRVWFKNNLGWRTSSDFDSCYWIKNNDTVGIRLDARFNSSY